jgi:hypothetical protein
MVERKLNKKEYMGQWIKDNHQKVLRHRERYREKNHERILKTQREKRKSDSKYDEWTKNRRRTNLKINLNHKISTAIRLSLRNNKNGRKWEILVGYSLNDLIEKLEKAMPKGYTWQDYLEGRLHIDHIIPKSVFNFNKSEHTDFRKCWALDNLRLLPAKENRVKHNKLKRSFQPAFKF